MAREEKVVTAHTLFDALAMYEELRQQGYELSTENHLYPTAYVGVYMFGMVKEEGSSCEEEAPVAETETIVAENATDVSDEVPVQAPAVQAKKPGRPARKG